MSDDLGAMEEIVQVSYETFPSCDLLGGFFCDWRAISMTSRHDVSSPDWSWP